MLAKVHPSYAAPRGQEKSRIDKYVNSKEWPEATQDCEVSNNHAIKTLPSALCAIF